jgi:hypothetical protein
VYLLIISVFTIELLVDSFKMLPKIIKWVPEIFIILIFINILIRFAIIKEIYIYKSILFILFLFMLNIATGLAINGGNPLYIIIGMRNHLKFIPILLLPAVYNFTEKEVKNIISLIVLFLIVQVPITIYQRFYQFRGVLTGDVITGTVGEASVLTIILIMGISVVFAFYLSKKISLRTVLLLSVILFIPTTINETKGTLILFPIAIITPIIILWYDKRLEFNKLLAINILAVIAIASFVPIYNTILKDRFETGLIEQYSDKKTIKSYLFRASEYETDDVRRGDAIVFAFRELTKNGIDLLVGKGIGNVTKTIFDKRDKHKLKYSKLGAEMHTLSIIIWETGLLGLVLYISIYFIVFKNTLLQRKETKFFGTLALGWCSVNLIFLMSIVYKNVLQFNTLNILYWFFSGIIIAKNLKGNLLGTTINPKEVQ